MLRIQRRRCLGPDRQGHRRHLDELRAGHRRHHRSPEHPTALDPHRGHAGDLATPSKSACPPPRRGRHPACGPRFAGARDRAGRDHRRQWPAIEDVRRYVGDPEYLEPPLGSSRERVRLAASGRVRSRSTACRSSEWSPTPEHGPGFDGLVGGGLSTNWDGRAATRRVGPADDVLDVWKASSGSRRDQRLPASAQRARPKFSMADQLRSSSWEVLEQEYSRPAADRRPTTGCSTGRRDHVDAAVTDGRFYVGAAPTVGRVSGTALTGIADHGAARFVPAAPDRPAEAVILDVAEPETAGGRPRGAGPAGSSQ